MLYPKKNLLPPFTDSRWRIHPNAKLTGEYSAVLTANANYNTTGFDISLIPGRKYTLSSRDIQTGANIYVKQSLGGNDNYYILSAATGNLSFTAVAGATYKIEFHNGTVLNSPITFKEIQLEEGDLTPFEPYQLINKRAALTSKNLLPSSDGFLPTSQTIPGIPLNTFGSSFAQAPGDTITVKGKYEFEMVASVNNRNVMVVIPVTPGKTYKPSCITNGDIHLFFVNAAKATTLIVYDTVSGNKTAVAPPDAAYVCVYLTNRGLGPGTYYFKNWQLEEVKSAGDPATAFEPFQLTNKRANQVPKKNLIKDFLSSDWFADYSVSGGIMKVDPLNPYKMVFTIDYGAQGRLIWIPVETGKTYTFSFKNITGLYRFYKRKVGNHDTNMVLVQDGSPGKPDTFSFTADSSYQGFVTLRLTFGTAGTFLFEGLQLEEGTQTPFEPYQFANKRAVQVPKKNLYKSDLDYLSGINASYYSVDANGWITWIQPSYQHNLTPLVDVQPFTDYTFSFEKLDPNANARIEVTDENLNKFADTADGKYDSLTFNTGARTKIRVKHQSTTTKTRKIMLCKGTDKVYEPYTPTNKPAVLYPQKNLINLTLDNIEQGAIDGAGNWSDTNQRIRYKLFIPVKPNTDYAFSLEGIDLSVWYWAFAEFSAPNKSGAQTYNSGWLPNYSANKKTAATTNYIGLAFSKRSNPIVVPSDLPYPTMKMQLEEGTTATLYEPYRLGNKRA
ncbi:tail protein [Bacillus phage Pascal]|uniref:Tail protein n=1 Tax=Bacillus phage Pascal TaxID=1540092 RepID=A0A0A0RNG2_9CAUD|nr:tail protein [Bacillus phage Pascal]AIW03645.1 tail protein [Bacillus phage Pascal]